MKERKMCDSDFVCARQYCGDPIEIGSDYCANHTCKVLRCINIVPISFQDVEQDPSCRDIGSNYCAQHRCVYICDNHTRCNRQKVSSEDDAENINEKSRYCSRHKILYKIGQKCIIL